MRTFVQLLSLVLCSAQTLNLGWVWIVDDGGPDDEVAQSDLNSMGFNKDNAAYAEVGWAWDDTVFSGKNTGDACSLWDLDKNGYTDFALCAEIQTNAITGQVQLTQTQLFSCNNKKQQTCPYLISNVQPGFSVPTNTSFMEGQQGNPASYLKSYCVVDFSPDPFENYTSHAGAMNSTSDTRALCRLYYDELTDGAWPNGVLMSGDPQLMNVCSYPSGVANSDFKDCVVDPSVGFLIVNKWTNQAAGCPTYTAYGTDCPPYDLSEVTCTLFNCTAPKVIWNFTYTSGTIKANASVDGWGWTPLSGLPAATYTVSESKEPAGWVQIGFKCSDGTTNPAAVQILSGQTLVCYYLNYFGNVSDYVATYGPINASTGNFGNVTLDVYQPTFTNAPTPLGYVPPSPSCPQAAVTPINNLLASCTAADFTGPCSPGCLSAANSVTAAFVSTGASPDTQTGCLIYLNDKTPAPLDTATMNTLQNRIYANPPQPICSNGRSGVIPPSTSPAGTVYVSLLLGLLCLVH